MRGLYEYYINNISILYYIYIEFKKEEQIEKDSKGEIALEEKNFVVKLTFYQSLPIYTLIHGFGMMNGVLPIMSSLHNVATSI